MNVYFAFVFVLNSADMLGISHETHRFLEKTVCEAS